MFIAKKDIKNVSRRCLNSYTSENMIIKHQQQCIQKQITSIRSSPESHLHRKNLFHKNLSSFRIYADFEADNEKEDNRADCNKTTNIYKQNPVCNGYEIVSELEDVLRTGYHKSRLGYEIVDWFVDEIIKLENKMNFYSEKTKKAIIIIQEDKEDFENNNIFRFCEKDITDNKVWDHCHLTGKYRGPAHNTCNINVKQKDSNFLVLYYIILVTMVVIYFLKS